jgi:hypothetical protein
MAEAKEPFIASDDRPEMKIDLDKPLSALKVRDLQAILGIDPQFTAAPNPKTIAPWLKENRRELMTVVQGQKPAQAEIKDYKLEKVEKLEVKELKHEKVEHHKEYKVEKLEKNERVEVYIPNQPGNEGDPEPLGITQLAEHIGGLHKKIDDLTSQFAEFKKTK